MSTTDPGPGEGLSPEDGLTDEGLGGGGGTLSGALGAETDGMGGGTTGSDVAGGLDSETADLDVDTPNADPIGDGSISDETIGDDEMPPTDME